MPTAPDGTPPYDDPGHYRLVTETIPHIVWSAHPGGGLTYVNRRGLDYTGSDLGRLAGPGWQTLVHPDDLPRTLAVWAQSVATGRPHAVEYRLRRSDGEYRWHLVQGLPLKDAGGRVVRWLGTCTDIEDRKRAEAELLAWRARFEAAVRATGQVLYDWDPATGDVQWGGSCEETLGYPPGEMPRTVDGFVELIHPEDRAGFEAELARVTATGDPARLEYRVRRRDGVHVVVEDRGHFVAGAAGAAVHMVGFVVDVTERRRLEEQLRQGQKMEAVGRLAGGVAHDFNNLLTVASGYSDLALAALPDGHPVRPLVEAIRDAGEHGAHLTRQLLAFSRKQVLQPRVLDLGAVVADLGAMLRRVIGEDVALNTVSDPDLRPVRADPGQVEQVVMNLAVNARDAMPRGGRLKVETRNATLGVGTGRSGPHVLLSVSDTGAGMTEEVRARAFEPFFTTKPVGQGTGLGLSTVYGVAHAHGGHVEVDSRVGDGTTVRVYLPAADEPLSAPQPSGPRPDLVRGTETVLVVEDDSSVRGLTCLVLGECGYTVLEADGAAGASLAVERHAGPVHLLVTDVVMPGVSGRGVAEVLRAGCPGLRVLFVSGYTDDEVVRRGVMQETAHFLHKPFTPSDLARKVREVLDAPVDG